VPSSCSLCTGGPLDENDSSVRKCTGHPRRCAPSSAFVEALDRTALAASATLQRVVDLAVALAASKFAQIEWTPLDDSQIAITIGDVAEDGLAAVATMSRLRAHMRASVIEGHDPG
jgi:hypothetical protein